MRRSGVRFPKAALKKSCQASRLFRQRQCRLVGPVQQLFGPHLVRIQFCEGTVEPVRKVASFPIQMIDVSKAVSITVLISALNNPPRPVGATLPDSPDRDVVLRCRKVWRISRGQP